MPSSLLDGSVSDIKCLHHPAPPEGPELTDPSAIRYSAIDVPPVLIKRASRYSVLEIGSVITIQCAAHRYGVAKI